MARRKKNPSSAGIIVGTLTVGTILGLGYWYAKSEAEKAIKKAAKKAKKKAEDDRPPLIIPDDLEDDGIGISLDADCSDFDNVVPPPGFQGLPAQAQAWGDTLEWFVATGEDLDPFVMAQEFLSKAVAPHCEWPPSVDASSRIVNLYIYTTAVFAVSASLKGATVLGVSPEYAGTLEDLVFAEAESQGYPPFDPQVLPEFISPQITEEEEGFIPEATPLEGEAIPHVTSLA